MKRINTLEDQLNRMKSLMTEERLYGNLIHNKEKKIILQEQLKGKGKGVVKKISRMLIGPDINIPKLNKTRISKINAALKNLDSKNLDEASFKAEIAALYKNVGADSSPHIQKLLTKLNYPANDIAWLTNQIELMEKYILNGLHKGKSASEIADDLGKNFTTDDVIDMVGIVYGNNKGIKKRLKIGGGDVYAKQDKDYLDINTNKGKEADSKFKTKVEGLAIRIQKITDMPEELQQATKQIDETIESGGKKVTGAGGEDVPTLGQDEGPKTVIALSKWDQIWFGETGRGKVLGTRKGWSDSQGIIIKTIKGVFYRIRLKPFSNMWDWAQKSRIGSHNVPNIFIRFIRYAISYSPIELGLWAIYTKYAPYVKCKMDGLVPKCEYDNEAHKVDIRKGGVDTEVELYDNWAGIAYDALVVYIKAHPFVGLVSGKYPYAGIDWLLKDTLEDWQQRLLALIQVQYLCCPATPPKDRVSGDENYWLDDSCSARNMALPDAGCLYPNGPPTCEEFYNDHIKNGEGEGSLKNRWKEKIMGEMSGVAVANFLAKWGSWGKMGLDEYIQMQIDTALPNSKTFCNVIGKHLDWAKIKEDVDETVEAMKEEAEELGETVVEKLGFGQLAVEEAIRPYVWNGKLNCDDWKKSPMFDGPQFEKTLGSVDASGDLIFEDSIEGFITYYCPGLKAHNGSVNDKNCSAGIKAACDIT